MRFCVASHITQHWTCAIYDYRTIDATRTFFFPADSAFANRFLAVGLFCKYNLCPPTLPCLLCSSPQAGHNKPCDDVVVHALSSIRCENNYDRFDDKTKGWSLYTAPRSFVVASEFSVIERKLLDFHLCFSVSLFSRFVAFVLS